MGFSLIINQPFCPPHSRNPPYESKMDLKLSVFPNLRPPPRLDVQHGAPHGRPGQACDGARGQAAFIEPVRGEDLDPWLGAFLGKM